MSYMDGPVESIVQAIFDNSACACGMRRFIASQANTIFQWSNAAGGFEKFLRRSVSTITAGTFDSASATILLSWPLGIYDSRHLPLVTRDFFPGGKIRQLNVAALANMACM